jgi:hypothetical protein
VGNALVIEAAQRDRVDASGNQCEEESAELDSLGQLVDQGT